MQKRTTRQINDGCAKKTEPMHKIPTSLKLPNQSAQFLAYFNAVFLWNMSINFTFINLLAKCGAIQQNLTRVFLSVKMKNNSLLFVS